MAWAKAGTTTLSTQTDPINFTVTANKFNNIMLHGFQTNSSCSTQLNVDNSFSTNYASRYSHNGATDSTGTSQAFMTIGESTAHDRFQIIYCINIASEEKLFIGFENCRNTAGAGTAPSRAEMVGKSTQSSQFTSVTPNLSGGTGEWESGTNATVIGSDGTEALNVQDGAIYYDTDLNKEYVLYNNTWTEV